MKIVLATDGSKYCKKAVAFLVKQEWVHGRGVEIVAANVQPKGPDYEEEARAVLDPVERQLKREKIARRGVALAGDPAIEIVKLAKKEKAEIIVMGTRGLGALKSVFMGSVAQAIVSTSTVPVLLVK
ncbi:universal stress protein [Ramlibacter sp. G-1-2-2]|uniref:Universal stress protein n=1 Tax=Ramlibacter agri TaxID=2728837 RepID=A0A848HB76_9BURK|nr:universal stress protein [Ramlibacter agri]NML47734.1 universal stress protein [Ramlibacter agri]